MYYIYSRAEVAKNQIFRNHWLKKLENVFRSCAGESNNYFFRTNEGETSA